MSFYKKYLACKLEKTRRNLSAAQGPEDVPQSQADHEMPSTSSFSSSSPGAVSPCSFRVSASAAPAALLPGTLEDEVAADMPQETQKPPPAFLSPGAMADSPQSQGEGNDGSEEEGPGGSQELAEVEPSLPEEELFGKMADLVVFLLFKYRSRVPTTEAEMQSIVLRDYKDFFPLIFSQACECLQLIFGIEVREEDPQGDSYVLISALDPVALGPVDPEQAVPKNGLLMMVLAFIVLEGDCASEQNVWHSLSLMGVYPGREHPIFGEPRELLTRVWVQEQYLEYRRAPGSCPAQYVFLWGPRAHAATNKRKILELWDKVTNMDPRCFLALSQMGEETA